MREPSFGTFSVDGIGDVNVTVGELLNTPSDGTEYAKQRAAFKLLIKEEASEVLKYNALRAVLKEALTPPIKVDDATLSDLVNGVLSLAKILIKKYDLYINEHAGFLSKSTLLKHKSAYEQWLNPTPLDTKKEDKIKKQDPTWVSASLAWFSAELTTERMNPRRLYTLRARRLLVLLAPIIKDFGHYSSWVLWADGYVAPFLTRLAAVFFLPRLMFNMATLYDNVFEHDQMRLEAKKLDWFTRFWAQWMRLWPQLMNDIGWTISGTVMCLLLIGAWQPFAIYLSLGMQFYDVLMVSIRMYLDFSRFNKLLEQYKSLPGEQNFPIDEKDKALYESYCTHLEKGIQREKDLLYLALANAIVIFFALCLSLPMMVAISPWLPITGAVIAIIMTVINFQGREYLNTPEPQTLENLMEPRKIVTLEAPSKENGADVLEPLLQQPTQEASRNTPPPISPRFFPPQIIRSPSVHKELKVLPDSSSPTGVDSFDLQGGILIS